MNIHSYLSSPLSRHALFAFCAMALFQTGTHAQTKPAAPPAPAASASQPAPVIDGGAVLATGPNGATIRVNDVMSELQRAPEATRKALLAQAEAIKQLVNNLLIRRALAVEAERDGIAKDPMIVASLAIARDRVLSDARLARLDAQNAPTNAALEAYARNLYQANPEKFERPAQTRARHILLANNGPESLQKAKDLLTQLRAGASFEELAKANSTDRANAQRGGDLGFFGAGKMVRPFEEAVNKLAKPGDLSEPVETQFGYHIIRLEERREKGRLPYDEVRNELVAEARTAILNESRVSKAQSLSKDFVLNQDAVNSLVQPATR